MPAHGSTLIVLPRLSRRWIAGVVGRVWPNNGLRVEPQAFFSVRRKGQGPVGANKGRERVDAFLCRGRGVILESQPWGLLAGDTPQGLRRSLEALMNSHQYLATFAN